MCKIKAFQLKANRLLSTRYGGRGVIHVNKFEQVLWRLTSEVSLWGEGGMTDRRSD